MVVRWVSGLLILAVSVAAAPRQPLLVQGMCRRITEQLLQVASPGLPNCILALLSSANRFVSASAPLPSTQMSVVTSSTARRTLSGSPQHRQRAVRRCTSASCDSTPASRDTVPIWHARVYLNPARLHPWMLRRLPWLMPARAT